MEHHELITKNAPQPLGSYRQAVCAGAFIFVSGQIGIDPATNTMADGVVAQTHQALKNIVAILEAAGSHLNNVVRADVFLSEMKNFEAVNKIYAEYFSAAQPQTRFSTALEP